MEQPTPTSLPLESQDGRVPLIEIAYGAAKWWSFPTADSKKLYEKYCAGEQGIGYVWDWGDARPGSYINPEGENTTLSRYGLDFNRMQQTNLDNKRKRSFRIVWVLPEQVEASWTGEIRS